MVDKRYRIFWRVGWGRGYRMFCKDHQVGLSYSKWVWWHTSIITEFGG